jgi:hypothetical protein
MKESEAIRNYLTDTFAVSEDNNLTCRIMSQHGTEPVLVVKFSTTPNQGEIEYTVRKIVENEDFIPAFLIPAIIRQVEATVIFKMKLG